MPRMPIQNDRLWPYFSIMLFQFKYFGFSYVRLRSRLLFAVSVWLALALNGTAQIRFDSWTIENGLPQNSVTDILQTHDGYLWLATFGGLVRFDGVRFVTFDRTSRGIESQRVRTLHEDRQGILWAATDDGMLLRYQNGRFTTYSAKDGLPHAIALRIEEDNEGCLWITWLEGSAGGERGSITKFDGQRFVTFRPDDFAYRVMAPPEARFQDLWWNQNSAGLDVLIKGRIQTYPLQRELLGADITRVTLDRQSNVWINTAGAGVIKAAHGGRLERYTTSEGIPNNNPEGVFYEGSEGDIWFADYRDNLYRIRHGEHELVQMPTVGVVYVDREGSTWMGTAIAGLHRVRDNTIRVYTEHDGLSSNRAYSILEDRAGGIWIGTWYNGVNKYANGRFTSYNAAEGLPSPLVTCIYEDKSGRIWVGTSNQGLVYFHNGRFRRYEKQFPSLNGSVWAIHEDRTGAFWFATDKGLVKWADGRFVTYTRNDGLSDDHITALFEDRSGALWLGTFHGITRLKDGVFTAYIERDGFSGNQVRAIHEDSDGILWVGTYDGGLYRFADGRLTRYTRKDGLHDNGVFQILEDDSGYFWMGSNRGISRVSRRELNEFAGGARRSITSVAFGARDGLPTLEVNGGRQPPGLKAADGKLWFPTMGGVAVLDPTSIRLNTHSPAAIIEEVRLAGGVIDFSSRVRIPPEIPVFEIRYTAPSFSRPEQIRFRYRLQGLDNEWIDAGDRRIASFYRIPPGTYRFVVSASSPEGSNTETEASLNIVVLPPFWRTWWFTALALIAAALIVFAGHEGRVRRLRAQHEQQTAFSQQLIESQESERRRISNEMHDSFGQYIVIIKKLAQAALHATEGIGLALDEIASLAEQMRAEMKHLAYDLRPYQLDKIGLSKTVEKMIQRVGQSCHLEFATDIDCIDDLVPQDLHIHIYRIVQESLSNIVKHSKATRAKVTITKQDRSIQIKIEDNGQGFDPDRVDSSTPTGQGFGLMGIHERARILGGKVEVRSTPRAGTAIIVTVTREG
jgi:signal transduction histidine kinase/ligand-binding sensor domain-containing protein